jgi:hypothetical protein
MEEGKDRINNTGEDESEDVCLSLQVQKHCPQVGAGISIPRDPLPSPSRDRLRRAPVPLFPRPPHRVGFSLSTQDVSHRPSLSSCNYHVRAFPKGGQKKIIYRKPKNLMMHSCFAETEREVAGQRPIYQEQKETSTSGTCLCLCLCLCLCHVGWISIASHVPKVPRGHSTRSGCHVAQLPWTKQVRNTFPRSSFIFRGKEKLGPGSGNENGRHAGTLLTASRRPVA